MVSKSMKFSKESSAAIAVGSHGRSKMPISQRAKQFMPFAALKGLDEALRQKEWEIETKQKML